MGAHTLTAPLEAHLQITNRCDAGCRGCYTAATPRGDRDEWGLADWKRAVDALADMGVFHLALGGGESAQLPWLGQLARYARHRGLVPNLTTSGLAGLAQLLPIADEFGQINVSLDGLSGDGGTYAAVRGFDGFARADAAVRALRKRKAEIGINVVVTRHNFHQIDALFAYARKRRLNEIELLRFKPAGRGVRAYAALACTDEQHRQFLPRLLAACKRHRIRARVDCSYTPMLAHHSPDPALLSSLAVYGCTGGDFLVGAKASGQLLACSFAAPDLDRPDLDRPDLDRPDPGPNNTAAAPAAPAPNVHDIGAYWHTPEAFADFRSWRDAEEPCASCRYHTLCRGGCKVVSAHVRGHARLPDPECPRVVDWQRQRADRDSGESGPRADAPTPPRRRLPILDS